MIAWMNMPIVSTAALPAHLASSKFDNISPHR